MVDVGLLLLGLATVFFLEWISRGSLPGGGIREVTYEGRELTWTESVSSFDPRGRMECLTVAVELHSVDGVVLEGAPRRPPWLRWESHSRREWWWVREAVQTWVAKDALTPGCTYEFMYRAENAAGVSERIMSLEVKMHTRPS